MSYRSVYRDGGIQTTLVLMANVNPLVESVGKMEPVYCMYVDPFVLQEHLPICVALGSSVRLWGGLFDPFVYRVSVVCLVGANI